MITKLDLADRRWASEPTQPRRPRRGTLALASLAVLFGACAPAIRGVPEPVAAPPRFAEPPPTAAEAEPLPDRWWLAFRDPVLDGLEERALAGNFTLRRVWDRLAQAEASAQKAGALLLPALDAEAGVSRSRVHVEGNGDPGTTSSSAYSLGLAASYEADLWGRLRAGREAARLDLAASREDLRAAAITLSAGVAATWYELVEQYGQLDLLDRQVATNEQVLELTTLRFRRGQAAAADVLQQRQLVESTRGERALVEARASVLNHGLAVLLGQPPEGTVARRVSELVPLPPFPQTGLPAELIRRRPDVRGAHYRVAAADRRVAAAIADRYPKVSLSAEASTSGAAANDLFRNWLATLAANLLAPVFDGGERAAEVERTRAVAAEALHGYGQTVLEALGEVEDALAQERRQREHIESLDRQIELSTRVIERVRDRYVNGAVDYLRVLDALLTHQQLQRSRLTARRELLQQRITLCRSLGGGWELKRPEPIQAPGQAPGENAL